MPKAGRGGSNMGNIRKIIEEEILRNGAIPFARFMELALYCPNSGYYERPGASPGRRGDYFTSVSVGSLFGEMLAFQIADWVAALPAQPRQIVEAGAHDGCLARDILRWLRTHRPEFFNSLEYWILEPSVIRRRCQQKTLEEFSGSVRWFDSWGVSPPEGVRGVIFANELLDAMPVRRFGWDARLKKWFEWGVTLAGGQFEWTRLPEEPDVEALPGMFAEDGSPCKLPRELLEVLPDGFSTEVCPVTVEWWRQAARALQCGKLMTLDYGLAGEEFFTPERSDGTLRAYFRHQSSRDLFANVGEQDLTAQVNFTAITGAGRREGLRTEGWTNQARFLTGIMEEMFKQSHSISKWTSAQTRQFQTLTHPEHLGRFFKVLVQSR